MKYFLALDKGQCRNLKDRYNLLDMTSINPELIKDNNLKALVKFTCSFNTFNELKYFLIEKGLLNSKFSHYDLVIYYENKGIKSMDIAFKCDEEYFDINRLKAIIMDKCKNEAFLNAWLNYYKNNSFLSEDIRIVKAHFNNPFANHKFFEAVKTLINKLCYKKDSHQKYVVDFKRVYELGLLVSKLCNSGRTRLINSIPNQENSTNLKEFVSDTVAFEMEQLQDKMHKLDIDEDQFKLF